MTFTCVEVSSTDTSVSIYLRLTMSMMAKAQRRALLKCVTSQSEMRFGAQTSQPGHGWRPTGSLGPRSGSTKP